MYSDAWVDLLVPVSRVDFLTAVVWQGLLWMLLIETAAMWLAFMVLVIMNLRLLLLQS